MFPANHIEWVGADEAGVAEAAEPATSTAELDAAAEKAAAAEAAELEAAAAAAEAEAEMAAELEAAAAAAEAEEQAKAADARAKLAAAEQPAPEAAAPAPEPAAAVPAPTAPEPGSATYTITKGPKGIGAVISEAAVINGFTEDGTPAQQAGLPKGAQIVKVNGVPVSNRNDVVAQLKA
eukprot:SAG31_NODE_10474_length_1134_cov_1.218357_1_plen_178_part_10